MELPILALVYLAILHFWITDGSVRLNVPDYVYQLLVKQRMDKACELICMVGGHGRQVELVMKWFPRGSKWVEPFTEKSETSVRQKSKACRRRDTNRRKWYNVNRNSKQVETSDGECDKAATS